MTIEVGDQLDQIGWARLHAYKVATGLALILNTDPRALDARGITIVLNLDGVDVPVTASLVKEGTEEEEFPVIDAAFAEQMMDLMLRVEDAYTQPFQPEEPDSEHA